MVKFKCSSCNFEKQVPDKYSGKKASCPKCKAPNRIPGKVVQKSAEPTIKFHCSGCDQKIKVLQKYAGRKIKCPKCKAASVVPGQSAESILRVAKHIENKPQSSPSVSIDDLLQMEQAGPIIERPVEEKKASPEIKLEEPVGEPGHEDSAWQLNNLNRIDTQIDTQKKSTKGLNKIICLALIAANFIMITIGIVKIASFLTETFNNVVVEVAANMPVEYMDLLANENISESKEFLSDDLQGEITEDKIKELTDLLDQNDVVLTAESINSEIEGRLIAIEYSSDIFGEEVSFLFYFVAAEMGPDIDIDSVSCWNKDEQLLSWGPDGRDRFLNEGEVREYVPNDIRQLPETAKSFFESLSPINIIITILLTIPMCVVYSKAGEPFWAAIIPFYNMWVLVKIADKSELWAVGILFCPLIPFIGPVISLILMFLVTIGVARALGRGILFGIGMFFLPMIFVPILAFWDD